jgi:hypothetical protein
LTVGCAQCPLSALGRTPTEKTQQTPFQNFYAAQTQIKALTKNYTSDTNKQLL